MDEYEQETRYQEFALEYTAAAAAHRPLCSNSEAPSFNQGFNGVQASLKLSDEGCGVERAAKRGRCGTPGSYSRVPPRPPASPDPHSIEELPKYSSHQH